MSSECVSCGDPIPADGRCAVPRCQRPEDPRCGDCHAEIFHGAIPDVTGDGVLGGNAAGRGRDPSPSQENNVRLMEDGPT